MQKNLEGFIHNYEHFHECTMSTHSSDHLVLLKVYKGNVDIEEN
jgi:hypothetical protein